MRKIRIMLKIIEQHRMKCRYTVRLWKLFYDKKKRLLTYRPR